jgi:hypothetical protein
MTTDRSSAGNHTYKKWEVQWLNEALCFVSSSVVAESLVLRNLKQVFDMRNTDGTTFGAITKDNLFSLKVIRPLKEILIQFSNVMGAVFEKQNTIALENQQLASLRDWLLPMLMNGQVKVN